MSGEAAVGIEGDDVNRGNAGDIVHRQVVIGDESARFLHEVIAGLGQSRGIPYLRHDGLGIAQREALKVEAIVGTAHHVEEDAVARFVVGGDVFAPVLRTEAEGALVVALVFGRPIGSAVVFCVEANEIYADLRIQLLEMARHFEQYGHT